MNYYCDESCYLQNVDSNYMVIGTLRCSKATSKNLSNKIDKIKIKYGLPNNFEIKSTKISSAKYEFYKKIISCFINNNIGFRAIIIDKSKLNHKKFNQSHDDWYYKMYYTLIEKFVLSDKKNTIFMDYKDSHSIKSCDKLSEVLYNTYHHNKKFNVVPIDSKDSNLIQLADILTGLTCYKNKGLTTSSSKLQLISYIESSLNINMLKTNYDEKYNIFIWRGQNV